MIEIYTDGACSGNPGPGGWGVLLRIDDKEMELCGGEPATTNNRMELLAVIEALQSFTESVEARVYTDSQYVQKGISEWIHSWKQRGWKTAGKDPVKNEDLWRRLDALAVNIHSNGTGSEDITDTRRMSGRMRWLGPVLNRLAAPVDPSMARFTIRSKRAAVQSILLRFSISDMPRFIEEIPASSRISLLPYERGSMRPSWSEWSGKIDASQIAVRRSTRNAEGRNEDVAFR